MSTIKKLVLPGRNILNKNESSGFLFNEDYSAQVQSSNSNSNQDDTEDQKNIHDTLTDSIVDTKQDIATDKIKSDELNKVLSVTKDSIKRNYLSTQLKDKKDEIVRKNTLLKNQEAGLKNQEDEENKPDVEKKEVKAILSAPTLGASATLNLEQEMKQLRKKINEAIQQIGNDRPLERKPVKKQVHARPEQNLDLTGTMQPVVKKKDFKVVFDKSTGKPWEVLFTERGFLVNGSTRLSFENVEMAIHKNYNITLDGGQGLVLDQVKLNKILKYKNKV